MNSVAPDAMAAADLKPFFDAYARASRDADPKMLAALYAPTFIVAGPKGSHAFANDETFLEWIKGLQAFNKQVGMTSLSARAIGRVTLSPAHVLATVTWSCRFARTGDRPIEFRIAYLLEIGDAPKVLAYVSEADQEEEMKRQGVT
jgi:hypothetical protein